MTHTGQRSVQQWAVLWMAAVVCLLSLWRASDHVITLMQEEPFDHAIFAHTGHDFWQTGTLYPRVAEPYPTFMPGAAVFKFPPMYQLAIAPWVKHGITQQYYLTCYLGALALYVSAVLLIIRHATSCTRHITQQNTSRTTLFALLATTFAALYEPFYNSFTLLTGELLILFCCTVACLCLTTRPALAGFMIATAACTKLYPAFMLLAAVLLPTWPSRSRYIAGFAIGMAWWCGLSLAVFGWQEHAYYLQHVLPVLLQEKPMSLAGNLNPLFFIFQNGITHVFATQAFNGIRWLTLAGCLFVLYLHRKYRTGSSSPHHTLLFTCLLMTTMVIWLANSWIQYQLLLLPSALIALRLCLLHNKPGWLAFVGFVTLILLSSEELRDRMLLEALQNPVLFARALANNTPHWLLMAQHAPLAWITGFLHDLKPLAPYALWWTLACLTFHRTPVSTPSIATPIRTTAQT